MFPIESNLQLIRAHIELAIDARSHANRNPVTLVGVSKTKSAECVRAAYLAGLRDFGENYLQEASAKIAAVAAMGVEGIVWHFIGPLQSNKLKLIAAHFDWVHGIDRLKVANALSRHRGEMLPAPRALNLCVQVNVSGEASKGGIDVQEVSAFAAQIAQLPHLKLRGLMAIIENTDDESTQRAQFRRMRSLFDALRKDGVEIDTLSMGMSQDFAIAIDEGATMVRIGSAIFGTRA